MIIKLTSYLYVHILIRITFIFGVHLILTDELVSPGYVLYLVIYLATVSLVATKLRLLLVLSDMCITLDAK